MFPEVENPPTRRIAVIVEQVFRDSAGYLEEGVGLLEMARDAQGMFAKQPALEK